MHTLWRILILIIGLSLGGHAFSQPKAPTTDLLRWLQKEYPTLPPAYFTVYRHPVPALGAYDLYIGSNLNVLLPPRWVIAVHRADNKILRLTVDDPAIWNQIALTHPWKLADPQSLADFAARFIRIVAPSEKPKFSATKESVKQLSPSGQSEILKGWRFGRKDGLIRMQFFSQTLLGEIMRWEVDLEPTGSIRQLQRKPLE